MQTRTDFTRQLFHRNLPREHGFEPLRVEGALPPSLRGTLFRNGPGIFEAFGRKYDHPFEGDGVLTAVRFEGGRALGAARAVLSRGLAEERAAGKILYGTAAPWWRRMKNAHTRKDKNTANTNVMTWQNRLFAVMEAALPTEIDPRDLSTIGETNLGGVVASSFSAHPHRVPSRKATYNFGVEYGAQNRICLYELPDEGPARKLGEVPLADPPMVHDFAVSERYAVFFVAPVRLNMMRVLFQVGRFKDLFTWRPDLGTEIIVVPLDRPDQVVRIAAPPFFQWHFANAFDEGDRVIVDYLRFDDFRPFTALDEGGEPDIHALYHRAEIDLSRRTFTSTALMDVPGEFPMVHPEKGGRSHRYAWLTRHDLKSILRYDLESGALVQHELPAGHWASEPILVPYGEDESDVHVLVMCHDDASDCGFAAIYDGQRLAAGPVARAYFDHYVTATFHGAWLALP